MPELPEVETVKLGLQPTMLGHKFTFVETRRGDLRIPFPENFERRLLGQRVNRLWRRAKYILADLDGGETLVIHLGMSGRISINIQASSKHDHVVFDTDAPAHIVFTDHRRFGLMTLVETKLIDSHKLFRSLGIEPLSEMFDATHLTSALKGKKTPIKSALLDQRIIAGLGNIYVCEALWRAGISPKRRAARVTGQQIALLVPAIQSVLKEAMLLGGSSLRDHRRTNGELGEFQKIFSVYDREGEPCLREGCAGIVRRITQGGRSSFYCPGCQR